VLLRVPVLDVDDNAVDLNGATSITYRVYGVTPSKDPDAPTVITKSIGNGLAVTDAAGGIYEISIDKDDTLNLWPGSYYHQSILVDSQGKTYVTLTGTFQLTARN